MDLYSGHINRLIEELAGLPGIGNKSAQRQWDRRHLYEQVCFFEGIFAKFTGGSFVKDIGM